MKCSNYFNQELKNLKNINVIVALGKVAFDNCLKIYKEKFKIKKNLNSNIAENIYSPIIRS